MIVLKLVALETVGTRSEQHCGGGSGPNTFGAGAAEGDAQHDMGRALEHWVEDGVAPEQIVATGPVFKKLTVQGDTAWLDFDSVGGGSLTKTGTGDLHLTGSRWRRWR